MRPVASKTTDGTADAEEAAAKGVGAKGAAAGVGARSPGVRSSARECRMNIPVSEWARGGRGGEGGEGDESGDGKYKKRRASALAWIRVRRWVLVLSALGGGTLIGLRVWGSLADSTRGERGVGRARLTLP